jgi:hypothetical protein
MLPNYRLGGLSISFQSVVPCVTVLYKQLAPSPLLSSLKVEHLTFLKVYEEYR